MQAFVARTYSAAREDIFNVKIKELPEYSVIYKMLFKSSEKLDEYTKKVTTMNLETADQMSYENKLQAAKFQVEYYFGQTNYIKDDHL